MRTLGLAVLLVLALLSAGACIGGGDDGPTPLDDRYKAFLAAVGYVGDDPSNPPALGTQFPCSITVALQPASPQPTLRPVLANCIWQVEPQGNLFIATFNESWRCDDFAANSIKYPACVPPIGFHEWQYQVDIRQGKVDEISSKGQFAPDMRN
ncbi:MAG: hypothetical protein ABI559_07885 [Chloroflexota bacterium]